VVVKPFRLTAPEPTERDIHEAVADALDACLLPPAVWFCYPAGHVKLSAPQAARLVRAGLKSGMPDIFIFYRGVYLIELKAYGGRLSKSRIVKTKTGALREIVGQEERFKQLLETGAVINGAICSTVTGVLEQCRIWELPMRGRIAA